jgi:hypothetical protein
LARVVIRESSEGDWITVTVDGVNVIEGHRAGTSDWERVLVRCGVEVVQDDGDFCSTCTNWTDDPQEGEDGTVCPKCKEAENG